ncbi:MAG TPA: peptidase, partial [Firmicutes bacterium]|nr:peptidase [Bacillota bacterium]
WGIKVNRVELKNILPPRDIQEAMEKQMRAEREKREAILRAEGEKQSAILTAQGEKESVILQAEAQKVAMIKEAEGRAEAMIKDYQARAESIRLINEAKPSQEYLQLKSFECYSDLADGKSTKLVVPTELGKLVSDVAAISAAVDIKSDKGSTKAKKE